MNRTVPVSAFIIFTLSCAMTLSANAAQKDPDGWIAEANDVLKADPLDAKAYYNRGTGFYERGDYVNAVKDLSSSIALEPNASDSYFNRGLSYRRQRMIHEAISDLTKAIELYPAQPVYYVERCNALLLMNDLNGAIADCSEAIRLSPEAHSGYFLRGIAYMLRGDLKEALVDDIQTLQIWPGHPDARRLMYEILVKRELMPPLLDPFLQDNTKSTRDAANGSGNLLRGVSGSEKV